MKQSCDNYRYNRVITIVTASPAGSSRTLIQTFTTASEPSVISSLLSLVDSFDASARPATMTTSHESSKLSDLSTQELPEFPTVQEMRIWKMEKVLRWIQQRDPNILEDDDM